MICVKIELTDDHIADIITELRSDIHLVEKLWNFCVPTGEWNIETKMMFIVSALPASAECSSRFVVMQLRLGPEFLTECEMCLRPFLVHQWAERYVDTAHEVAELYASMVLVPSQVKDNVEWCCLCAIREALQMIKANGGDPVCMGSDIETIQSTAVGWLYAVKRLNKSNG